MMKALITTLEEMLSKVKQTGFGDMTRSMKASILDFVKEHFYTIHEGQLERLIIRSIDTLDMQT